MTLATRIVGILGLVVTFVAMRDGTANQESQNDATPPGIIPVAHLRAGTCEVAGAGEPSFGSTPPSVSPHPVAVDAVWIPGLNDKSCKPVLVRGDGHIASSLARDIDSAPFVPKAATYMCPDDDLTSARLYFTYGYHRPAQRINAELKGCSWITAPSAGARRSTSQFRTDLLTLAPTAWAPYLSGRTP